MNDYIQKYYEKIPKKKSFENYFKHIEKKIAF